MRSFKPEDFGRTLETPSLNNVFNVEPDEPLSYLYDQIQRLYDANQVKLKQMESLNLVLQAANDTLDFMFRLNRKYMKIDLTKLKPGDKLKESEKTRIEQIYARRVQNKAVHVDVEV